MMIDRNKTEKLNERYRRKIKRLKFKKAQYDRKQKIREIKKSMRRIRLPTTTKLMMLFIFANCSLVEGFSMLAMWRFADLSSLYALITAVVTETMAFAVYAAKAYHETKQEELMKLEREKLNAENEVG